MIVAVGGGSVIDSAKITSICIADKVKAWDVMTGKKEPVGSIPLIAVLTLAATGTEMNQIAVIQNPETKEKIGFKNELMFPVHSFLDPAYTITVPPDHTGYGIADLIAHALEAFYGSGDASLSDKFVQAIIKEAMEYGPSLLNDLQNYDLRAKVMWAATNALNGLTSFGRKVGGDWGVHALGHTLSFLYDTPHGATLTIAYPAWLKLMKERIPDRIIKMGKLLFNTNDPDAAILKLESFFSETGNPVRLEEVGIEKTEFTRILELMNRNNASGAVHKLNNEDRKTILEMMFK